MIAFQGAAFALATLALAIRLAGREHRLLHLFQLEHYEGARLMLWLKRRAELFDLRELLPLIALYGAAVANVSVDQHWVAGSLMLITTPIAYVGIADWRRPAAKPLVFTPRAKRLLAASLAPALLILLAAIALAIVGPGTVAIAVVLGAGWLLLALAAHVLLLARIALQPVEARINAKFVDSAKRTLQRVKPLSIGITGSYGKTTTKFCVGAVLAADRPTFVTPSSFNSHLGVVRAINEGLVDEHQAFVAEMGMFRRGDIAQLCELTHPSIGVITAIGPMHLERLGSIEQIVAAKAELLQALPKDGFFVTNGDDQRCLEIASSSHVPVTLFGIRNQNAHVRAANIELVGGRTEFDLILPDVEPLHVSAQSPEGPPPQVSAQPPAQDSGGQPLHVPAQGSDGPPIHVSAQLLGDHNVLNLLAAAAVGHLLGIDRQRIADALQTVQAPEHRLSPIRNDAAGILVIDDAYNSNPDGAAAALQVLQRHQAQRRLLVTPGMVELGDVEEEANRAFGAQAASVCDLVVLVGPQRTRPIREGLIEAGMADESIHTVNDIAAATTLLRTVTRAGDVILFENDLPDTYAENGRAAP